MALTRVRQQQLNTTVTGFDDPLIPINAAQTGENTSDIGFVFNRGTLDNAAIIWDETNDTFKVVLTNDNGGTNQVTANIVDANFSAGNIAVSGSITGNITGNSSTATSLQTARLINGVAFDGSTDITITAVADAGVLSGNTIAANVLYSSLTSVGTLGNLEVSGLSTFNEVIVNGNLTVNGSATIVNSTSLSVVDKNITLANGAADAASANGAGITVGGANATITYSSGSDSWVLNKAVSATSFSGAGTGLTGTAVSLTVGTATVANALATARNINGVAFDGTADITVTANASTLSGTTLAQTVTDSSLTSVGTLGNLSVTGTVTAGTFSGAGTDLTGTATTLNIGGTAGTATKLATGRYINGELFDGTQNITITAAANTLTGTTLNSSVVNSSLTSVGTLHNITVGESATYSATGLLGTFASNIAGYNQLILQNKSDYVDASSSFVVSNDIATDTSYYGEFGINSSTYSEPNSFGLPSAVLVASASSDLSIGTYGANDIHFINNNSGTDTATFFANGVAKFTQPIIGSLVGGTDHADKLTTARNINGVPFDGTADITVTANASTLSGTYINSSVTSSSLTTVGNLTALEVTGNISTRANINMPSEMHTGIWLDGGHGWKDLIGDVSPKTGNANAANMRQFIGAVSGWTHTASSVGDLTYHLPHDYAPNTDLFLHVHWGHNGTAISGSFVVTFYASYAKRSYPATTFATPITLTMTLNSLNMTNSPRYCHRVDEIQLSTPGGSASQLNTNDIEVDGLICIHYATVTIPSITGSDFSNLPYIQTIDIHMQSTGVGTARKDPGYYT
jgi:hypothetical protein